MKKTKIKYLILNTLYREYWNKTLIILFVGTTLLLYLIHSLINFLQIDQGVNFLESLNSGNLKLNAFYLIISSWNGLLSLSLGLSTVKSDESSNVLQQILAFPIKRSEYLIARIVGTWLLVMGYYLLSMLLATGLFLFSGDQFTSLIPLMKSLFIVSLIPIPLIMIAILFSFYLSKVWALMSSILLTLFISYSGQTFSGLGLIESFDKIQGPFSFIGHILYWIFPRISIISKFSQELFQEKILTINPYAETFHFVITSALFFIILNFIFKKRG